MDAALNLMKKTKQKQNTFFSLQEETMIKWLHTVESFTEEIIDIYID